MKTLKKLTVPILAVLLFPSAGWTQTVEEVEVSSGQLLDIALEDGGTVEITGWERSTVRVEAESSGRNGEAMIGIRKTAAGVEVRVEEDHEGGVHHRRGRGGHDVKVRVPSRFDLEIETAGGAITISGVEGRIEGETMGGKLDLSNLKGTLKMSTMGGNIRLVDSQVDGKVSTMGGQVLLENVLGDVDGSSLGGNVTYKNVQRSDGTSTGAGEVLHITTMGGNIELAEAPHGAELETMGGNIVVGSAGGFVEAETMGGNVILREVDGRVTATTMGGDVEVRIVGDPQSEDRNIELSSMSGEVRLTVPRGFSMDVEIELAYTKGRAGRYAIESDLGLTIQEEPDWDYGHGGARKIIRGSGVFAGGKNTIKISTINGNVELRQED